MKRVLNRDRKSRLFLSFCSGQGMIGLFLGIGLPVSCLIFFSLLYALPGLPLFLGLLVVMILLSFMRKRLLGLLFK